MEQHKYTFERENLVVDYITFKFQEAQCDQNTIADYLFNLGFNSYQESGKSTKPIKQPIFIDSKNQHEISFIHDNLHWKGTLIHFSGLNAAKFYFLAKQNIINWKIFEKAILSRFDLYCERNYKKTDTISGQDFLANCHKELKQKNKNISLEKNNKGFILKIGNRKTNNYSRIYEGKDSLKFEHEMKGKFLQPYHLLFVESNFDTFEQKLSSHFFVYFGKLLPLQYSYLDWLVVKLRPLRQQLIFKDTFNSDSIQSEIKTDPIKLIALLQFVNYAQSLDYEIKDFDDVSYRVVTFKLQDFLQFQNRSNNKYQLKKIKDFFEELQTDILITSFSSKFYQSLVAVPLVRFDTINKFCVAKVWLVKELFYYQYPFFLPNFFNTKLTNDEFNVRFKFIQTFTSVNMEKVFLIEEFLTNYPAIISNQRRNNIKKYFIELVKELKDSNLIESNYKILMDGSIISVNQLTTQNISQGFIIYEKISL
jgi:ribosomal protein S24E